MVVQPGRGGHTMVADRDAHATQHEPAEVGDRASRRQGPFAARSHRVRRRRDRVAQRRQLGSIASQASPGPWDGAPDPGPEPDAAIRIGITGHSDLTTPSYPLVTAALRTNLLDRTGRWVGVSCLARGADQLFAHLALELGAGLDVILPARDYRARKIAPDNTAEFDRLVAAATTVSVLDYAQSTRAAYMAASTAMLDGVNAVLAVWDGHPARRRGSTADVVTAAHRLGLPLTVLWPTGAARHGPNGPDAHVMLVLAGLEFPAQRREIIMYAEHNGADHYTRQRLAGLPDVRYLNLAAITKALARHPG